LKAESSQNEAEQDPKKDYWTILGTISDYTAGIGGRLINFLASYLPIENREINE